MYEVQYAWPFSGSISLAGNLLPPLDAHVVDILAAVDAEVDVVRDCAESV
jgi:hypothetical protein